MNNKKIKRPDWDEYFLKMAMLVSERSTCRRHHVGAVLVRNKRVLTTGYNGAAKGLKDCLELGCLRDELKIPSGTMHEKCRAIHAEQNAIVQASNHGINIDGSTLYCTHTPCSICAKMLINAGVEKVVSYADYPDKEALEYFKEGKVKVEQLEKPTNMIYTLD